MEFLRWNRLVVICICLISFVKAEEPFKFIFKGENPEAEMCAYFDDMAKREAYDEMAQMLLSFRQVSIASGIDVPSLPELAQQARDLLRSNGVDMPQDLYEQILEVFETEEIKFNSRYGICQIKKPQFELCKHKHKHKHKSHKSQKNEDEIEITPKMAIGFCKFIAGALCSVIPYPVARAVGVALITSGINDMTSEMEEKTKQKQHMIHRVPRTYH